jgi:hypothetical protein
MGRYACQWTMGGIECESTMIRMSNYVVYGWQNYPTQSDGLISHFLFSTIYINIWDNPSHWRTLIFFKMVKSYCTTNQYTYVITCSIWIPMDHFGMWSTGILDMSTSQKFEDWPCHVLENLISANRAGVPRGGYPNGMWRLHLTL